MGPPNARYDNEEQDARDHSQAVCAPLGHDGQVQEESNGNLERRFCRMTWLSLFEAR